MKNNVEPLHLLSLNAPEYPFLLEQVYAVLDQARIRLVQLRQLVLHGQILLLIVLEIPGKAVLFVLKKKHQSLDRLQFYMETLDPKLDQAIFHDYILTLLGRRLSPSLIGSLLAYLRKRKFQVKSISPLEAEQAQIFELKIRSPEVHDLQMLM